ASPAFGRFPASAESAPADAALPRPAAVLAAPPAPPAPQAVRHAEPVAARFWCRPGVEQVEAAVERHAPAQIVASPGSGQEAGEPGPAALDGRLHAAVRPGRHPT